MHICLVSSRKHDGQFVLPKGGVEKGEDAWQSAEREMWEEGELMRKRTKTIETLLTKRV